MAVKVTVIAAIRSYGINLKNALDSLKNQTLSDIEILLCDAGSTDETKEIMQSYLGDSRFRYIRLETNSISEARNHCIDLARGKYVAFCDKNVIFSENLIKRLYECAEQEQADLCIAPMASSDIYGKHEFTSTGILSRRKKIDKFDTDIIWNPAVTNKLFLKSKLDEKGIRFRKYGKAREAAFSIPCAFESDNITVSSKGLVSYINPVDNEGVSDVPIEHYLDAYEYIITLAQAAFHTAAETAITHFDRKELKKQSVCYIDQIYHKEITVLLYSYYRHFWSLSEEEIKKYADAITDLVSKLSKSGKRAIMEKNKDIFYGDRLITSKKEMAENPKATVCIGMSDDESHHKADRLSIQVSSIFMQTMPSFELLVDSRLRDVFPEKWKNSENVVFVEAECLGEFKDNSLEKSRTQYIMYQDGFARLNPKILMRHYCVLEGKDKYGFSTSPLTKFDGNTVSEYSFSDLSYYSDIKQTRTHHDDDTYALDLFFCNKLFRTEHLNGIRFSFSNNAVADMYKLYSHSRFKKLSHRGAYLPYTEDEAIAYLKAHQQALPSSCRKMYRTYKSIYFRKVTLKKAGDKTKKFLSNLTQLIIRYIGLFITAYYKRKKIKQRVFFYSSRADGHFLENLGTVYSAYEGEKAAFYKTKPHKLKDLVKIRKYILTSKVIVTDDYIDCLRTCRLRPEQGVIQIWYTGGAFRRFGLDSSSLVSPIDEYKAHSQYTDVCVSSEYVRQFYSHAFGVDMDITTSTGTPRSDLIVKDTKYANKREEICKKHPLLRDKKVYVYFPTFREEDGEIADFDPKIKWAKLNDELDDDEVFVLCRHPFMNQQYIKGMFYSRVKDYTADPTTELIAIADVIITDYSSIVFDASLMGKPMVFYAPDYKKYEGEFYLDYEKYLPGEIIYSSDELLTALRRAGENSSKEKIAEFCKREMDGCDGKATDKVIAVIEKRLKGE
ncbi:MAG: CDP-glycerol glycerophosphotransferase family protein [Clostridia bacterium]|nr:CDP-glycerol glycerophosphotransferase family protein [Clostridia bacterium]